MAKKLVAYFSASGVTKKVAENLAKVAEADLFEIKPEVPYTSADLDWMNKKSRSTIEMEDPSSRPAIAETLPNMDEYSVVFVGYPIWWYREPSIIDTFLEAYDFAGKTVIPFATSGGSNFGSSESGLHGHCSADTTWETGKVLNRASGEAMKKWVESLGI